MKHITKLSPPQSFIDWYNLNNATLQATCEKGDDIWSCLPSQVKEDLNNRLLKEQGHICAYCGIRIGKEDFLTFCIEHFLRKGDPRYKHLTLNYTNLLGCCKISQQTGKEQTIAFPIPEAPHLKILQDIVDYLEITIENLKENNKGFKKMMVSTDLEIVNSQKPAGHEIKALIYKANIHHCDDTKFDDESVIINPTENADCENYFGYDKGLNTKNEPISKVFCKTIAHQQVVENTIDILNLNATNLCLKRVEAYEAGVLFVNLLLEQPELVESIEAIETLIQEDIYQINDDKLEPFCFVIASVVRSSFS